MLRRVVSLGILPFSLSFSLFAHAVLLESSPAHHAAIAGADVPIHLKFNSRIDGTRSRLTLIMPDQRSQVLRIQKQTSPDTVASQAPRLKPGRYKLRWQVLAADGHITRGEVAFDVK